MDAAPDEPIYRSYLALLLDAAGDAAAAEVVHRAAAAMAPTNALVMARFARFLLRRGCAREGLAVARAAVGPADRDAPRPSARPAAPRRLRMR